MKVASGEPMQSAFGGMVSTFGDAIILSAEDDKDEMHRRIERMDPMGKRREYPNNLKNPAVTLTSAVCFQSCKKSTTATLWAKNLDASTIKS